MIKKALYLSNIIQGIEIVYCATLPSPELLHSLQDKDYIDVNALRVITYYIWYGTFQLLSFATSWCTVKPRHTTVAHIYLWAIAK